MHTHVFTGGWDIQVCRGLFVCGGSSYVEGAIHMCEKHVGKCVGKTCAENVCKNMWGKHVGKCVKNMWEKCEILHSLIFHLIKRILYKKGKRRLIKVK